MALRRLIPGPLAVLPNARFYYPQAAELVEKMNEFDYRNDVGRVTRIMREARGSCQPLDVDISTVNACPERSVIAQGKDATMVFMNWQPGQTIPRHTHEGLLCWMRVLTGTLLETVWCIPDGSAYTRNHDRVSPVREILDDGYEHSISKQRLVAKV